MEFLSQQFDRFKGFYFSILDMDFFGLPISRIATALFVFLSILLAREIVVRLVLRRAQGMLETTTLNILHAMSLEVEKPLRALFTGMAYFSVIIPFTISPPNEEHAYLEIANDIAVRSLETFTVVIFFWVLFRFVGPFFEVIKKYTTVFDTVGHSAFNFKYLWSAVFKTLIGIVAFITIFEKWGFNAIGFIASLSVLGAGVAFAARDSLSNLFGSLMITLDQVIKKGDWIKFGDLEGNVEELGFRSIKIRTFHDTLAVIPNSLFAREMIINFSKAAYRRLDFVVKLDSKTDGTLINKVLVNMRKYLDESTLISQNHMRRANIDNVSEGQPAILVTCFALTQDTGPMLEIKSALHEGLIEVIRKTGAEIAVAERKVTSAGANKGAEKGTKKS